MSSDARQGDDGTRGPEDGLTDDLLRITWLGHATCAIRIGESMVLTDPVIGKRIGHLVRFQPLDPLLAHGIDAIFVSHAHRDHLDLHSLRRLVEVRGDHLLTIYAPPGAAEVIAGAKLRGRVMLHTVVPGDAVPVDGGTLRIVPAHHDGTRAPWNRPKGHELAVGCVLERGGRSIYFPGDTDTFDGIADIGPVEVALLPVGGWWRTIGPGHLDGTRAAEVARLLRARVVVPIHWGTFHPLLASRFMGDARTLPVRDLERALGADGSMSSVEVLQPGGQLEIPPA